MKNYIILLMFLSILNAKAQKTMDFYPIADDGMGFHIAANAANTNYSKDFWNIAHVQPGGLGMAMDTGRTLILFDFQALPAKATIKKITLSLFAYPKQAGPTYYGHGGKDNSVLLQRVTSYWKPSIVTWNTRPSVIPDNQIVIPHSSSKFEDFLNLDVTALFLPMVQDKAKNFGIEMKLQNEFPTNDKIFCSTNYSDQSKHPKLTIYYEEDNGGGVVVTPPVTPTVKTDTICESKENYFIPNSFSPNDDGINDYFTVYTHNDLKISYLRVFDRWGEMVFEANNITTNDDIKGWNGKFRGRDAPRGTYTYDLKVSDAYQCVKLVKGDISLWR